MIGCICDQEMIKRQARTLEARYKSDIRSIDKAKGNPFTVIKEIINVYAKDPFCETRGNRELLPALYVLRGEFDLAWRLAVVLHIRWGATNDKYNALAKMELERPEDGALKPFSVALHDLDEVRANMYAPAAPFVIDDPQYNDLIFNFVRTSPNYPNEQYDPSAKARYKKYGDYDMRNVNYYSIYDQLRILPWAFRQERHDIVSEMLIRLRWILSTGEPPKHIMGGPKLKQHITFLHMYDLWFQARRTEDQEIRKLLAAEALFWYLEAGIRTVGTTFLRDLISFTDFCEIIGEFELLGNQQDEFFIHFKKWSMHASMSFCIKMQTNSIRGIPFSERNMPTYDEIRALYAQQCGSK